MDLDDDHLEPMNRSAWRYYARLYRGSYRTLLLSLVVSVGQSILVLAITYLIAYAFDEVIPTRDSGLLILTGVAIVMLYLLNGAGALWTRYVILRITKSAILQLRCDILEKFYAFSRSYYSETDRGTLHTMAVQDTERLDIMSNALVADFVPALLTSIALCIILAYLNWLLFLVMISIVPVFVVLSRSIGGKVREHVRAFRQSFETFSKGVLFVLQVMDLTRIQSAEGFELRRQRSIMDTLRLSSGRMAWVGTAYSLLQSTILAAAGVIILVVGGQAITLGQMTLGELLSFYAAVALLRTNLQTTFKSIPSILQGNESLNSLYDLLQTSGVRPYWGTQRIAFRGGITLESVSFQYRDCPVLLEVDLTIRPGTTVALMGPNGSGKSTIVNLVLGFYRPCIGQVCADDHPFSELDVVDLRRQVGVVTQDPTMLPGTIWENIIYGYPDTDPAQVIQAAKLATAHEFIEQLPQRYDTIVGEDGILLSGGQGQRVAIARALLRRPKLLILDEPTNHLDEAAVQQLMNNLRELDSTPATLLISHDVDIVRQAQYVYVLHQGRIVASGLPVELLQDRIPAEVFTAMKDEAQ